MQCVRKLDDAGARSKTGAAPGRRTRAGGARHAARSGDVLLQIRRSAGDAAAHRGARTRTGRAYRRIACACPATPRPPHDAATAPGTEDAPAATPPLNQRQSWRLAKAAP